jgi:hypothetical protein
LTKMATHIGTMASERALDIPQLATKLAQQWLPLLAPRDWKGRLDLLHMIHEQLQEDLNDLDVYCQVSPILVEKIIDLLGDSEVSSREQAHVYANSANPAHRRVAGEWLARQHHDDVMPARGRAR